jgi:hypothetical protein
LLSPYWAFRDKTRDQIPEGGLRTLFDIQTGVQKGTAGFVAGIAEGICDIGKYAYKLATDPATRAKTVETVQSLAETAAKVATASPADRAEMAKQAGAYIKSTAEGIGAKMESEWAAAAEVGKESELLATWATRGLLEIAAVLVPASKVAAAGKAAGAGNIAKAADAASDAAKAAKTAEAAVEVARVGKSAKAPGVAESCSKLDAKRRRHPPPYLPPRIPEGEQFVIDGFVVGRVRPNAGKSVIGKNKPSVMDRGYLQTAEAENANYFNMNGWVWQEQEAVLKGRGLDKKGVMDGMWNTYNKPFIEGIADRGERVVLSHSPTVDGGKLVKLGSGEWSLVGGKDTYFSREVSTLLKRGYTPGEDGLTLVPPGKP